MTRIAFKTLSTDPRPDGSVFTIPALQALALQQIGKPVDFDGKVHVVTAARVERRPQGGADLVLEAEA